MIRRRALLLFALTSSVAAEESILERGRRIYTLGEGHSSITATLAAGQTRVSAALVPCGNCHGADGQGNPEGGVIPSDLRFGELTKPYRVTMNDGRTRGPYTDRLLVRAITMGIDSSGNRLGAVMPRYQLTRGDAAALLAFLRTLGNAGAPGVDDGAVRIGVLLPGSRTAAPVRDGLAAWFGKVNTSGGVYGRIIEPSFIDPSAGALEQLIRDQPPFAIIAADAIDAAVIEVVHRGNIPLLATIHSDPRDDLKDASMIRSLLPGLSEQARALARVAAREGRESVVAMAARPNASAAVQTAMESFRREARNGGLEVIEVSSLDAAQRAGASQLLFAGSADELESWLGGAPRHARNPRILLFGSLSETELVGRGNGFRCAVAYPLVPGEKPTSLPFAAAKVLVTAMRDTGRELTRASFLAAIDSLRGFDTAVTPRLSFSPTRHIGSSIVPIVFLEPDGRARGEERVEIGAP